MTAHPKASFVILATLTIAAMLLSSCGQASTPTTAAAATTAPTAMPAAASAVAPTDKPAEHVTITWTIEGYEKQYEDMLQREFVDTFNAAHPNITLQMTFEATGVFDVIKTALLGGSGPDIVYTLPSNATQLQSAGFLLPLDKYAQQYGWKGELQSWAYDAGVIQGHLYDLPMGRETMYLFYNKDVFGKYGWQPPANRAELEKLCSDITSKGMWCFSQSNQFWKGVNEWLVGVFFSNYTGADKVYQGLTKQRSWEDPLFAQSIQLIKDYSDKGWFSGGKDNYFSFTFDDVHNNFCKGKAPMMISGTWTFQQIGAYCDPIKANWDFATLPILRDGVTSARDLAVPGAIGINAKSQHPDQAAAVIDWLYNNPKRAAHIVELFKFGRWLVPLKYSDSDFSSNDDPRLLRYVQDFAKTTAAGDIGYTTWTFWPGKTDQYIYNELDAVLSGSTSVADYMKGMQSLYVEETAQGTMALPSTSATSP